MFIVTEAQVLSVAKGMDHAVEQSEGNDVASSHARRLTRTLGLVVVEEVLFAFTENCSVRMEDAGKQRSVRKKRTERLLVFHAITCGVGAPVTGMFTATCPHACSLHAEWRPELL